MEIFLLIVILILITLEISGGKDAKTNDWRKPT